MKSEPINPLSLLAPIESHTLGIMDLALRLEQAYGAYMKPNPEGLYMLGSMDPVVTPGMMLYTARGHQIQNLDEFARVNEAVFTADGKLVLAANVMRQKNALLYRSPTVPAQGMRVIRALADYLIARRSAWTSPYTQEQALIALIEPTEMVFLTDGILEDFCRNVVHRVEQICENSEWNHFNVKIVFGDMVIEKGIDYRIYEYHRREYDQYVIRQSEVGFAALDGSPYPNL